MSLIYKSTFILIAIFLTYSSRGDEPKDKLPAQCYLGDVRVFNIQSKFTNKNYTIHVQLPGKHSLDAYKAVKYPVLYVLDGQWNFDRIQSIASTLIYDGDMPEVIIVGLAWEGEDFMAPRQQDLTPSAGPVKNTGSASLFSQFLKKELIPEINDNYKTNGQNTLIGASLSALYVTHSFLDQNSPFDTYIAVSPLLEWDNNIIFSELKEANFEALNKERKLHLSIGGYENLKLTKNFYNNLINKSNDFQIIKSKLDVVENVGHAAATVNGFLRGLQYTFERNEIQIKRKELRKIAGAYVNPEQWTSRKFVVGNDGLYLINNNGTKSKLFAEQKNLFYTKGINLKFTFLDNGNVEEADQWSKVILFRNSNN